MTTQYLKPDTSLYFNKEDYDTQMDAALARYAKDETIAVTGKLLGSHGVDLYVPERIYWQENHL